MLITNGHTARDPVLLCCLHCGHTSWAERVNLPEPQIANSFTGTWMRCGHRDCNKPLPPQPALSSDIRQPETKR